MYRLKARAQLAFTQVFAVLEGSGGAVLGFFPFTSEHARSRQRAFRGAPEVLEEYDAFLLECEIADLRRDAKAPGQANYRYQRPRAHVQAVLACAPFAFGVIPGRKWLQIGDPSETRFAIG